MHRYMLSLTLVGLTTGFIASGCGSDPASTPPSSDIPIENLSTKMADKYCAQIFSCCDMAELTDVFMGINPPPKTAAECATFFQPTLQGMIFAPLQDAVKAGRLAYDAELAGQCFGTSNAQCGNLLEGAFGDEATCNKVFTGKVATGGDCLQSIECAVADSACVGAKPPTLGKCALLPKENEACPQGQCLPGLTCASGTQPICIKPKADGMGCGASNECISDNCDFATMKCAAKKAIGEACSSPFECKDGWCDETAKMCKAPKAVGEACVTSTECASGECNNADMCAAPLCDGK